jgi:hypothetical protein
VEDNKLSILNFRHDFNQPGWFMAHHSNHVHINDIVRLVSLDPGCGYCLVVVTNVSQAKGDSNYDTCWFEEIEDTFVFWDPDEFERTE